MSGESIQPVPIRRGTCPVCRMPPGAYCIPITEVNLNPVGTWAHLERINQPKDGDLVIPESIQDDDETYVNAITTVVGEVGFHIDAQTRNALRQAFTAGTLYEADHARGLSSDGPREPDFDEWLDQYIEDHDRITSSLDSVSQSEGH